jgi:hypothetical protein
MKHGENCLFIFTLKCVDEEYIPEEKRPLNRCINGKKILKWIIIKYGARL